MVNKNEESKKASRKHLKADPERIARRMTDLDLSLLLKGI